MCVKRSVLLLSIACVLGQSFPTVAQNPFAPDLPYIPLEDREHLVFNLKTGSDPDPTQQDDAERTATLRKRIELSVELIYAGKMKEFVEEYYDPAILVVMAADTGRTIDDVYNESFRSQPKLFSSCLKQIYGMKPTFYMSGRVAYFSSTNRGKLIGQCWVYSDGKWRIRHTP